ncbi:MAG: T9SS type A sorting domain-containing protein [Chitinophagales bacterium]
MKGLKSIVVAIVWLANINLVSAQITLDDGDFADAGDTLRMSEAVWNPMLDYGATGANYTWDFSNLQWQSQFIDEYLNPLFTSPFYTITFSNLPFNPNRANLAKQADNTLTTLPIVSSIFTEPYNFYYKSSSLYRQRGLGMKVSGFPTPIPMAHSDTLYRFPIDYGDEDSSHSDYTVNIPQLGTYSHRQQRFNRVDGWGSLTTPFGTYDVLRIRTEILGSDSLYVDTLNFGIKLNNDIQREYKWFAKNQNVPLLQINTQAGIFGQFQGFEFVTKIVYRDSVRFDPTGILDAASNEIQFQVYPNPSTSSFYIAIPVGLTEVKIVVTDANGKLMLERSLTGPSEQLVTENWARGMYFLSVQSNEGKSLRKLVLQ